MHGNDDWFEGGSRYSDDFGSDLMSYKEAGQKNEGFGDRHAVALRRALTLHKEGPRPDCKSI